MNSEAFLTWLQACTDVRPPLVMGVLNITPDSFYDGGRYFDPHLAYDRACQLIHDGADLIDVGGESSRPGAHPISIDEELDRVIPVIERICATFDSCISIDTCKPPVMQAAVLAGANLINDISALTGEDALSTVARLNVPICLMHMQGLPKSMQSNPHYDLNLIDEINTFFKKRIAACLEYGIHRTQLILDPGFGFGKTVEHNLLLLKEFRLFQQHRMPLLLGVSRKSTIGVILKKPQEERLAGSLALAVYAVMQGASIIRTHDVAETKQALIMIERIIK